MMKSYIKPVYNEIHKDIKVLSIIEIIGPSGVGKSRLYKALLKEYVEFRSYKSAYLEGALRASREKTDTRPLAKFSRIIFKFTPDPLIPMDWIKNYSNKVGLHEKQIELFSQEFPDFLDIVKEQLRVYSSDEDRISMVFKWILLAIERFMIVSTYVEDDSVLSEEELISRSASIFVPPKPKKKLDKNDVLTYLNNIPCPDQIIFLKASPNLCLGRLKNRKTGFPGHYKNLNDEKMKKIIKRQIRCYDIITDNLRSNGFKIIELNAENSVDVLANKVGKDIGLRRGSK